MLHEGTFLDIFIFDENRRKYWNEDEEESEKYFNTIIEIEDYKHIIKRRLGTKLENYPIEFIYDERDLEISINWLSDMRYVDIEIFVGEGDLHSVHEDFGRF